MDEFGFFEDRKNEFLSFSDEQEGFPFEQNEPPEPEVSLAPWKVLIADDDKDIQALTKIVLADYKFEGRRLQLISAMSGEEPRRIVATTPDIAVILLDIIMEDDHAGFDTVRFIRKELKNRLIQIVLRTGQPGDTPEDQILMDYEINDYKSKGELTARRLYASITTCLRAYRLSYTQQQLNQALEQEISEREHTEHALRKSEEKYRRLVENLKEDYFFYRFGADGVFEYLSPSIKNVLGYTPDEFSTIFWGGFVEQGDQSPAQASEIFSRLDHNSTIELCIRAKDGSEHFLDITESPDFDEEGNLIAVDGIAHDITVRKNAESRLRQSEATARALLNAPQEFAQLVSPDGTLLGLNELMEEKLQKKAHELIGKSCFDLVPPDLGHQRKQRIIRVAQNKTPIRTEFQQGERYFESILYPIFDEKGEVIQIAIFERNITDRKLAEQELAKLNQKLIDASRQVGMAEIATGVLHNVGNVLNSVNVSSQLLAENLLDSKLVNLDLALQLVEQHKHNLADFLERDPKGVIIPTYLKELSKHLIGEQEKNRELIAGVQKNINHIKSIVTSQQAFARNTVMVEEFDLGYIVEEALKIAGIQVHSNIRILRRYHRNTVLKTDKQKVLQVLVNFLQNACDSLKESQGEHPTIEIHGALVADNHCEIEVVDNGVGISEENLTHIFSHGFTTKVKGHGFGLHSAALTAKELKGSIKVKSEGIGQGAAFKLRFPNRNRD